MPGSGIANAVDAQFVASTHSIVNKYRQAAGLDSDTICEFTRKKLCLTCRYALFSLLAASARSRLKTASAVVAGKFWIVSRYTNDVPSIVGYTDQLYACPTFAEDCASMFEYGVFVLRRRLLGV